MEVEILDLNLGLYGEIFHNNEKPRNKVEFFNGLKRGFLSPFSSY